MTRDELNAELEDAARRAVALAAAAARRRAHALPADLLARRVPLSRASAAANDRLRRGGRVGARRRARLDPRAARRDRAPPGRPAARRRRRQRQDLGAGRAVRRARCSRTGSPVEAILTITFTEKAAAELRDRIRSRLARARRRRRGPGDRGRVHLDDPRLLRPGAAQRTRWRLASTRCSRCSTGPTPRRWPTPRSTRRCEVLAQNAPGGVDLIAGYSPGIAARGDHRRPTRSCARAASSSRRCHRCGRWTRTSCRPRATLLDAAAVVAGELGQVANPGTRVLQAIERLDRCIGGSAAPTTPRGRDRSTPSTCRAATARR